MTVFLTHTKNVMVQYKYEILETEHKTLLFGSVLDSLIITL